MSKWNSKRVVQEFQKLYKELDNIDAKEKGEIERARLKIYCLSQLSSAYKVLLQDEKIDELQALHQELMRKSSKKRGDV